MGKIAAEDLTEGMEIILLPARRLYSIVDVVVHEDEVEVLLSNGAVYRYGLETVVEYLA